MLRLSRRRALSFVLAFAACDAMACGGDDVSDDTAMLRSEISADAVAAIPRLRPVHVGSPCAGDHVECLPSGFPTTAIEDSTWLVVKSMVQRKPQLVRIDLRTGERRLIGREGGGPGEYRMVIAVHVDAAGAVTALDVLQRRLIHYDSAGRHAHTATIDVPNGFIAANIGAEGVHFVATDLAKRRNDSAAVVRYTHALADGRPLRATTLPVRERAWAMGDMRPLPALFAPSTQWDVDPRGNIAHSDGDEPQFNLFGVAPERYAMTVGLARRRVTAADLEIAHSRRLLGIPDSRMRSAILANREDATALHPTATRLVLIGDELWVRGSPDLSRDSVSWLVLRPRTGRAAGVLEMGADDYILARAGNRVLLAAVSSHDGEYKWVRFDSVPTTPPR